MKMKGEIYMIMPYLNFAGDCEEAFQLYQKAFSILEQEGEVIGQLTTNPPPHDNGISGMVKDKFGFVWVLSADLSE